MLIWAVICLCVFQQGAAQPPLTGTRCTDRESLERFVAVQYPKGITYNTRCPDATWIDVFLRCPSIKCAERPIVMYHIGCNKGFDALKAWMQVTRQSIDLRAYKKATGFGCGACNQCTAQPDSLQTNDADKKQLRLFCVEPMPATFDTVSTHISQLGLDKAGLVVQNAAFTSLEDATVRNMSAPFPTDMKYLGDEQVGISVFNPKLAPHRMVPLMTVDMHVRQHSVPQIDIMSIDTEGQDALVLVGAQETLREKVSYVEFEYNGLGDWKNRSLRGTIDYLDGLGFTCYWAGLDRLWLITGCFHPGYDHRTWSNVACVKRHQREWYGIMEDIANRTWQEWRMFQGVQEVLKKYANREAKAILIYRKLRHSNRFAGAHVVMPPALTGCAPSLDAGRPAVPNAQTVLSGLAGQSHSTFWVGMMVGVGLGRLLHGMKNRL
uniref:Methyltransferase FkbM domain-containing protein n=1 Tax=Eutreptiella gymnastica TaxID=73025 RepID=A0A7S1I530_9EUGL|mmetsp:Transcript_130842/g.226412  ORF Transcript_130842/g.226412 Transcript_130842/m.226412 type:complete len:436 (+) Transcript_130842:59-1366(+)